MQGEHDAEPAAIPVRPTGRQQAVDGPVMRMDDFWSSPADYVAQLPGGYRIGERWMVRAVSGVKTRQPHRHGPEPVNADSRRKPFLRRGPRYALGGNGDGVTAARKCISKVEHMTFLTPNIWWEKLGQHEKPHSVIT